MPQSKGFALLRRSVKAQGALIAILVSMVGFFDAVICSSGLAHPGLQDLQEASIMVEEFGGNEDVGAYWGGP
jgi:hypothetical protein